MKTTELLDTNMTEGERIFVLATFCMFGLVIYFSIALALSAMFIVNVAKVLPKEYMVFVFLGTAVPLFGGAEFISRILYKKLPHWMWGTRRS